MIILVLNCGSSSIKYQLIDMNNEAELAIGIVEKVGMPGSFMKYSTDKFPKVRFEGEILDHKIGVEYILGVMTSKKYGCISSLDEINAVGHRVAHGGEAFKESAYLDDAAIAKIEEIAELAPLHNPANLKGIYAMKELLPNVPQVGAFDTSYHQTMPKHSFMYGIPNSLYEKYGIRRYGFHGTSHKYVANRACEMLGVDIKDQRIITCHLGNGASVTAIKGGESIDTSMGFTPIEGLMMGTRCGDLDIGVVQYIMEKEEIGLEAASTLFNKHSGVLGVTSLTSDMREVEEAEDNGNEKAALALRMYDYRVRKYIGAYMAALGGLDILVFTGGIGENADTTRRGVITGLDDMGITIDESKNTGLREREEIINLPDARIKVVVVPTNEELMIALDTKRIVTSR